LRTHTPDPVPYLLVGHGIDAGGADRYTEAAVADQPVRHGHGLIDRLVGT
jgi:2,3-bisphosphoglycerate-independent phosphoglycerate mutase